MKKPVIVLLGGLTEPVNRPEVEKAIKPRIPGDAIVTQSRTVQRAHDCKVDATDRWMRGEMSSAKHKEIHKRADRVIKAKGAL